MLLATHTAIAPWTIVRADAKKPARLAIIRHLLHAFAPVHIKADIDEPNPAVVFPFEDAALSDGRLAR